MAVEDNRRTIVLPQFKEANKSWLKIACESLSRVFPGLKKSLTAPA